jgi:hypothetical protein
MTQEPLKGAPQQLLDPLQESQKQAEHEEPPRRLISDSRYASGMKRALTAQNDAQRAGRGRWSAAGLKQWKPAGDADMIALYRQQRDRFCRIEVLVAVHHWLAELTQDADRNERVYA